MPVPVAITLPVAPTPSHHLSTTVRLAIGPLDRFPTLICVTTIPLGKRRVFGVKTATSATPLIGIVAGAAGGGRLIGSFLFVSALQAASCASSLIRRQSRVPNPEGRGQGGTLIPAALHADHCPASDIRLQSN